MLTSDLCNYTEMYIVAREREQMLRLIQILIQVKKVLCLKIMQHLDENEEVHF